MLFLISIHVDVNTRTQDSNLLTPLLLSVQTSNDMIVRNLLLAGADTTARNTSEQVRRSHVASEVKVIHSFLS